MRGAIRPETVGALVLGILVLAERTGFRRGIGIFPYGLAK